MIRNDAASAVRFREPAFVVVVDVKLGDAPQCCDDVHASLVSGISVCTPVGVEKSRCEMGMALPANRSSPTYLSPNSGFRYAIVMWPMYWPSKSLLYGNRFRRLFIRVSAPP